MTECRIFKVHEGTFAPNNKIAKKMIHEMCCEGEEPLCIKISKNLERVGSKYYYIATLGCKITLLYRLIYKLNSEQIEKLIPDDKNPKYKTYVIDINRDIYDMFCESVFGELIDPDLKNEKIMNDDKIKMEQTPIVKINKVIKLLANEMSDTKENIELFETIEKEIIKIETIYVELIERKCEFDYYYSIVNIFYKNYFKENMKDSPYLSKILNILHALNSHYIKKMYDVRDFIYKN